MATSLTYSASLRAPYRRKLPAIALASAGAARATSWMPWSRSACWRGAAEAYANTAATDLLDANKQAYVGGLLEMANARLYPFWGGLTQALKPGDRRTRPSRWRLLREPVRDPSGLPASSAMTGLSLGSATPSPRSSRGTVPDLRRHWRAQGALPVQIGSRTRTCGCRFRSPGGRGRSSRGTSRQHGL